MNPFESGARKAIPAVLVYVRDPQGRALMIHRDAALRAERGGRADDFHSGKWNGLGGKLDAGESPLEAAAREIREEAGLEIRLEEFRALGMITFPLFKPHKDEDWLVFLFDARIDAARASRPLGPCDEGSLHWIEPARIAELPMWPGDELFVPRILAGRSVMGTIWYDGGKVSRSWISDLA